jgi:hypothetical protein
LHENATAYPPPPEAAGLLPTGQLVASTRPVPAAALLAAVAEQLVPALLLATVQERSGVVELTAHVPVLIPTVQRLYVVVAPE